MPGRSRGRVLDKFPQQIHNEIIPAEPVAVLNQSIVGTFTEVEWSVPVTLSLRGSTLLEAGTISADLVPDRVVHAYTQPAAGDETAIGGVSTVRVWVMNEKRTAIPTNQDNAVLAYFEWTVFEMPMSRTATADTFTVPKIHGGQHRSIELEDMKTGQGALVAQPTLYIYGSYNTQSDVVVIEENAYKVRLTLHYRNVETPSGEEFVTELMAKFT